MTIQVKTIGRMPTDHGPYVPGQAYGKKFQVQLFGCVWESKHDNNNTAPATLNSQVGTITPNTTDWKKVTGSTDQWLIDNGYKNTPASHVMDSNQNNKTQQQINSEVKTEIGTNSTPDSIKGRIKSLENSVGNGGSVDSRIAEAKSEVIGDAGLGYNTLGKVEDKLQEENARATGAEITLSGRISINETNISNLQTLYNNLQQSQPIPVTSLPATGEAGKIYRLAGTTSYADYMFDENDLTTPIKMAEYDNATDNVPTDWSDNLVKSKGISKGLDVKVPVFSINELFNKETVTTGKYIDGTTGLPVDDPDYYYSALIAVDPNKTIYSEGTYQKRAYCYEEDLSFIGWTFADENAIKDGITTYVLAGKSLANTAFIRVVGLISGLSSASVRYKTKKEQYNPIQGYLDGYSEEVPVGGSEKFVKSNGIKTTELQKAKSSVMNELFDKRVIITGKALNEYGQVIDYADWFVSDFIPVDPTKVIYVDVYKKRPYFYDANFNFIGRYENFNGITIASLGSAYENTAYVRLENKVSELDTTSIRYNPCKGDYNPVEGYAKNEPLKLKVATYNTGMFDENVYCRHEEPADYDAAKSAYRKLIGEGAFDFLGLQEDNLVFPNDQMTELFDQSAISSDKTLNNDTGVEKNDTGWFVSDFMEVNPTDIVRINTGYQARLYCYDKDKNYIGGQYYQVEDGIPLNSITALGEVRFVRIEDQLTNLSTTSFKTAPSVNASVFGMYSHCYSQGGDYAYHDNYGFCSIVPLSVKKVSYTDDTYSHKFFFVADCCYKGKNITLVTFHFDWESDTRRGKQITQIINYCADKEYVILMGDTNCEHYEYENGEWVFKYLTADVDWGMFASAGYSMANGGYFGTFQTWALRPIDNIFVKGAITIRNVDMIVKDWMINPDNNLKYDHAVLAADLLLE